MPVIDASGDARIATRLRRRAFLGGALGLTAFALGGISIGAACGPTASSTTSKRPRRIGMISSGPTLAPDHPSNVAFRDGMKAEGFAEDSDYVLEYRFAEGRTDQLVSLAKELVALDLDVIVAATTGATQAARAVTTTVPIVMVASHDPVEAGVVANLAQPGANVTGQSLVGADLMPKQLEILREVARVQRVGYLTPFVPSPASGYPSVTDIFERSMREKVAAFGMDMRTFTLRQPGDVQQVVAALTSEPVDALYLIESPIWFGQQARRPIDEIVEFATRQRRPSIAGARGYAQAGLLIAYGDARPIADLYRSVTRYVAKILRGARPGDIPVERPTKFDLTLNLKTASALGLELPKSLLDQAALIIR